MKMIWAHSGDSHFLEPEDLWEQILPPKAAERMPRSEKVGDDEEIVHVDGQSFRRKLPKILTKRTETGETIVEMSARPPGARDVKARLVDLDNEGIWGEVVYSSLGLWFGMIRDRAARRRGGEGAERVDRRRDPGRGAGPLGRQRRRCRCSPSRTRSPRSSTRRRSGLKVLSLPTGVPPDDGRLPPSSVGAAVGGGRGRRHGASASTSGPTAATRRSFRGPGGAILNYVETTYGGQRAATKMVASGALDRHPDLKVLISEGGATWVPFLGDRMNEGYRQHGMFVRPKLSKEPKEILYGQVYASFQHDESAPGALWAMGYRNVMWGSDYPHLEGTFGHTQETLHELFDGVDADVRYRITRGAFEELFPHVSSPPES